ncbi:MAG: hypothetical protein ISR86_09990 [Nitrospinaceae bacterium]|nr:hypothetical protein [Nitrospinaceae bacterium]
MDDDLLPDGWLRVMNGGKVRSDFSDKEIRLGIAHSPVDDGTKAVLLSLLKRVEQLEEPWWKKYWGYDE